MSLSAATIRLMVEIGLSAEQIGRLASAVEHDIAQATAPKPRSANAERQAKFRERRRAQEEGVTRNVTGNATSNVTASVTPPSLKEIPPEPPKENNPPPGCAAPGADEPVRETDAPEDDWPEAEGDGRRAIATWAMRLTQLAGPALADPAKTPSLLTSSVEIGRWRQAGCSWEVDVVPVIQARTAQPRPQPINAWTYFTQAILAQASRRKSSLVIPLHPEGVPDVRKSARSGSDRQARYAERLSPIAAAMAAAVEQPSG